MRNSLLHILLINIVLVFLCSCMEDEIWTERNKPGLNAGDILTERGLVIINEGNFNYGNTSMSYYNIKSGKVENDVFYRQNGVPLGDVAHSALVYDGQLFVTVNNSGKVVLMNMGKYLSLPAFEYTGKITGLTSPRYTWVLSPEKGYITDLYARKISIFNPVSGKITGEISTANPKGGYYRHPGEQIIQYGKHLFINAYSFDDQILVIDTETDILTDSIRVLKQPNSMVADLNNKLWVLCDGGYQGSGYEADFAGLVRIDMNTLTMERVFLFEKNDWPRRLSLNPGKDTLFFINDDIYRMPVNSTSLPAEPFISSQGRLFYSLTIDPLSSEVYAGDAIDYVQQGFVYRYTPSGILTDSLRVGVNPGAMVFTGFYD